jgi:hypothetical protein
MFKLAQENGMDNYNSIGDYVTDRFDCLWSPDMESSQLLGAAMTHYLNTEFARNMSDDDKNLLRRYLGLFSRGTPSRWRYGHQSEQDDWALFPYPMPADSQELVPDDAYVMTGMLGYVVMKEQSRGEQLDLSLRDAIMIGGFAAAIVQTEYEYLTKHVIGEKDGIKTVLHVGGTMHGDLLMQTQRMPAGEVVDPLGNKWPFSPELPKSEVGAYHSTEPSLLADTLLHVVKLYGMEKAKSIAAQVLDGIADYDAPTGAFADFGSSDHSLTMLLESLHRSLDRGLPAIEQEKVIGEYIIYPKPNSWPRLAVVSQGRQLRFETRGGFQNSQDIDESSVVSIEEEQLPQFISALAQISGVRTDTLTMRKVLEDFVKYEPSEAQD